MRAIALGILATTFCTRISASQGRTNDSLEIWIKHLRQAPDQSIANAADSIANLDFTKNGKVSSAVAEALRRLSEWYKNRGQADSAIYVLNGALSLYLESSMRTELAETYLELKQIYASKAEYLAAQKMVFAALDIYEELHNEKGIAICYTHLCDLLYYEDRYESSIDYCNQAIELQQKAHLDEDLALSYRNKASSQLFSDGPLTDALETINKSIDLYKKLEEKGIPLLASINGRGNILKYMERYDDALSDYQEVYRQAEAMGLERYTIPALGNIGHTYILQKRYDLALPFHMQAIALMKKSGLTGNLWENYMHVSDIYESTGKYQEALQYHKLFVDEYEKYLYSIIDRLENEKQVKYETQKKDEIINAQELRIAYQKKLGILYGIFALLLVSSLVGMYLSRKKIRKKQLEIEKSERELKTSLLNLRNTQHQLIQAEKMASLGELTAGIAHEIQNPLNFVNNFSEINKELLEELQQEIDLGNVEEIKIISKDLIANEEKITYHGKRAGGIVKSMLEHSRNDTGKREQVDLNQLIDEYVRLAYHGLRAKDKSFNAEFKTEFEGNTLVANVNPQDFGRVLLNLIGNAFYAVNQKSKSADDYQPEVIIRSRRKKDQIEIEVIDNGPGISEEIKDKIFQPFYSTKPTGEGTGLGLSLSYDIIKAYGGNIELTSKEGKGSDFIITLPST
ncbi:MAG: tetratricopeptide repeat protein [Saprospiraceae bacterium]|nr:tetratricopeptide repeat protein [Saprospiraceae bacterium]